MSTVADYQGRTVDLLAFQGDFTRRGDRELLQALVGPDDGGSVVTGIQKLAQRVLIILLTRVGSMTYLPLLGTTFMSDAQQGSWRTTADIELSFNSSKLDLLRQLRAEELDTDPLDERIDTVVMLSAAFNAGDATAQIMVLSAAGSELVFIAPIPVTVR